MAGPEPMPHAAAVRPLGAPKNGKSKNGKKRRGVEVGVAFYIAFSVVGFVMMMLFEEPYPAALGPGFAGRPAKGGHVSATDCKVSLRCGDADRTIACARYVTDASNLRSTVILDRLFPTSCEPQKRKGGWRGKARALVGLPRDLRHCDPIDTELRAWLASYAKEHCSQAHGISVIRERLAYDARAQVKSRTELASYHVEFDRDAE